MEVIYLDVLIGINLIVNYLTLAATARLCAHYTPRWRLLCGATVGACYAVLSVLPVPPFFAGFPTSIVIGFGMTILAFGIGEGIPKRFLLFLLTSFAFAGCCTAIYFLTGTPLQYGGVYYIDVPFRIVLASCLAAYVLSGFLFHGVAKHGVTHPTAEHVSISFDGHKELFRLLLDTGNDLCDPVSGRPVLVLERRAAARLLPPSLLFVCTALQPDNCVTLLSQLPTQYASYFRLLPFHAVGTDHGLLLMFRPQEIIRANGKCYDAYVALSPQKIAGGQYEGLIGL